MTRARRFLAIFLALSAASLAGSSSAGADTFESPFELPCPLYGDVRICSAEVPSFDGAMLDVDVTLPMHDTGTRHPLIVMLHGLGNDKHEWESLTDEGDGADKYHWNNHWFAKHGYYVLTYTARGFRTENAPSGKPKTPGAGSEDPPEGTARLKSREFEVRDTQWLAAVVAASFPNVDPNRVAVTGGSYGGGESWVQASQPVWSSPNSQNDALPVLQLQVSIPKYPWTDLGYSLAPSGHQGSPGSAADIYATSLGQPNSPTGHGGPIGVAKLSYIQGLYFLANSNGTMENGTSLSGSEGRISFAEWKARAADVGDPYDTAGVEDDIVEQIRKGLTEYRASYYQDLEWAAQVGKREVAIFSISGWTDDLFTAVESFRQFKYLKALDPLWPVAVAVADVGHSRAQNKPATWHRLNHQAWQFLQAHINGSKRQQTTVYSEPTICPQSDQNNLTASQRLTATTPERLSRGTLTVQYTSGDTTTHVSGVADPNGPATDPVFTPLITPTPNCRTSPGPALGGYTAESQPLPNRRTYVGLGHADIPYVMTGGPTATVLARVWDVAPDGTALLVTRGAYRIDTPAYDETTGTLRLPLFGNHWQFEPGHSIRLDITQVDAPTFLPSKAPSALTFEAPTLVLPTRDAGAEVLTGS